MMQGKQYVKRTGSERQQNTWLTYKTGSGRVLFYQLGISLMMIETDSEQFKLMMLGECQGAHTMGG